MNIEHDYMYVCHICVYAILCMHVYVCIYKDIRNIYISMQVDACVYQNTQTMPFENFSKLSTKDYLNWSVVGENTHKTKITLHVFTDKHA